MVTEVAEVEETEDNQSATNVVKNGIQDMSALLVATNANYANVRATLSHNAGMPNHKSAR